MMEEEKTIKAECKQCQSEDIPWSVSGNYLDKMFVPIVLGDVLLKYGIKIAFPNSTLLCRKCRCELVIEALESKLKVL